MVRRQGGNVENKPIADGGDNHWLHHAGKLAEPGTTPLRS
jgi:hypothetical protein